MDDIKTYQKRMLTLPPDGGFQLTDAALLDFNSERSSEIEAYLLELSKPKEKTFNKETMLMRHHQTIKAANKMAGVFLTIEHLGPGALKRLKTLFKKGASWYEQKEADAELVVFGLAFASKLDAGGRAYIYLSPVGTRVAIEQFTVSGLPSYLKEIVS